MCAWHHTLCMLTHSRAWMSFWGAKRRQMGNKVRINRRKQGKHWWIYHAIFNLHIDWYARPYWQQNLMNARTHARTCFMLNLCLLAGRDRTAYAMLVRFHKSKCCASHTPARLPFFFYSDVRARCWMMQNAISSRLTHVSHKIKLYYILSNMWGTHNINDGSWVSSALLRHILHRKNMIYNRIEKTWKLRTIDVHRMFMLNNKTLCMSSLCVLISLFISNNSLWMFMVPN